MAGSMSWQVYTTDDGQSFAIYCDLSNAIAANASASTTPQNLPTYGLPRNVKPRYALFKSADGYTTRKVPLLTPTDFAALTAGAAFNTNPGGVNVVLETKIGEKVRIPKQFDSGLTV